MQYQGGKSRIAKDIAGIINAVSRWKIKNSPYLGTNNQCNSRGGTHSSVFSAVVVPLKVKSQASRVSFSMINTITLLVCSKVYKTDTSCLNK